MNDQRPIALTCGEPGGVGPEIAAKIWHALGPKTPFVYIGDPTHLPKGTPIGLLDDPAEALGAAAYGVPVLAHDFGPEPAIPGKPQADHAQHVVAVIKRAVELALSGEVRAVTTSPISKFALKEGAGFAFPGHTEYLADLAGGADVVMMLACQDLRVVPVTIHNSLADVPRLLTAEKLAATIRVTQKAMIEKFGITHPRLAIAGLNPHAGENGAMGREEIDMIIPTLDRLRSEQFDIAGPLPADTMFHPAARAKYDVAITMYHDQGLIPIKTLAFDSGVNVTLGLPFVRTSPDHGTAFDIAGKGVANISSTMEALTLALRMSETS